MLKRLWFKLANTIIGGAILIAVFSILSRLLGLLRDRLLASHFGAGSLLDSYYAAFKLPDLIFNTLVFGALAVAFIPVFTKAWLDDKEKALKISNAVLNYLIAILLSFSIVMCFIAPQIMRLIVPGFNPEELALTVSLTRIIIFSIVFFGLSNVIGGVLNSFKKFFSFSLAPIFYNLGIIMGIILLFPIMGPKGLAWGVVLGSVMHFLVQLPEVIRNGWHYKWYWKLNSETKKIFKLMLPRTLGLAANQISHLVETIIASTLTVGSIAIFNLANNLQSFPISVFGISLAIAVFPIFSEALADNNLSKFVSTFSLHFRRVIFLIIPVSIFMLLLRAQIVRIILGADRFDWNATYHTAQTLGWYVISLFAQSLIPMITRSFYAMEDTKTPVIIGVISIAINITIALILGPIMGVEGLALAFSIASILNMIILLGTLRFRLGDLDDKKIIWSTLKISFNSIIAGTALYLTLRLVADLVNMQTFLGIFLQGTIAGIIGLIVYLAMSLITNCEEITIVKLWLVKFLKPIFSYKNNG